MKNYKFKFRYASASTRITGEGTVKAISLDAAIDAAKEGVAGDLKTEPGNVGIISMREYKPRKKKAAE